MESREEHVRSQFSTVYITIASVLLGLNLAEVVRILSGLEHHTFEIWLQALAVTHLIFNAWFGYSSVAIILQVIPTVWDSLNVFVLAAAHFAMVAFIGTEPHFFAFAVSVYALAAIGTILGNTMRFRDSDELALSTRDSMPMVVFNAICSVVIAVVGLLIYSGKIGSWGGILVGFMALGLATGWLTIFVNTSYKKSLANLRT